ncbi:uncharacterized protein LOC133929084 [Phragmites australis]|uniref:uncharacterized protein LOC133929084 n=1 Tax=Phragmites australis TaxID=29695 RepID=UPI002D77B049|nr:uncharacterized protein LOC133929084 [Phragmites australis]
MWAGCRGLVASGVRAAAIALAKYRPVAARPSAGLRRKSVRAGCSAPSLEAYNLQQPTEWIQCCRQEQQLQASNGKKGSQKRPANLGRARWLFLALPVGPLEASPLPAAPPDRELHTCTPISTVLAAAIDEKGMSANVLPRLPRSCPGNGGGSFPSLAPSATPYTPLLGPRRGAISHSRPTRALAAAFGSGIVVGLGPIDREVNPTFLVLGLAESPGGPDILTNYLEPMGFCGSSAVDAEEQLDYSAGNVTIMTDHRCWERKLEESSELGQTVVIKFSTTWCGPCRNAAPVFAELSLKHSDLVFVSVDVDELPELVTQFNIRATPTFIFMRGKKEVDKLVGGNQADLVKKFDPYCQASLIE